MICLSLLLPGCAGHQAEPTTITCDTETLYQDRYVPVDERLTQRVEVEYVPDGPVDTIDLKVTLQACQTRTGQCNGQLHEIAGKQGKAKEPERANGH